MKQLSVSDSFSELSIQQFSTPSALYNGRMLKEEKEGKYVVVGQRGRKWVKWVRERRDD